MKISQLNDEQKEHLAYLLDHHTCCGLIQAARIARVETQYDDIAELFAVFDKSPADIQELIESVKNYKKPCEIERSGSKLICKFTNNPVRETKIFLFNGIPLSITRGDVKHVAIEGGKIEVKTSVATNVFSSNLKDEVYSLFKAIIEFLK